jgi:hypothetical protein
MTSSAPIGSLMHPLSCKPVSAGKKAQRVHHFVLSFYPASASDAWISFPAVNERQGDG